MAQQINDNYLLQAPKLIDGRSAKFVSGAVVPYASVQEALTTITSNRARFLSMFITISGSVVEYWFKDGIADNDLVAKTQTPFNAIAGTNMSLSGSYPNITFNSDAKIYTPGGFVTFGSGTGTSGDPISITAANNYPTALTWDGTTLTLTRNIIGAIQTTLSHLHPASHITSGVLDPQRLASGARTTGFIPTVQSDGSLSFAPGAGAPVSISYATAIPFTNRFSKMTPTTLTGNTTFTINTTGAVADSTTLAIITGGGYTLNLSAFHKFGNETFASDKTNYIYFYYDGVNYSYELTVMDADVVTTTPPTPSSPVTNDTDNTFDWTYSSGFTTLSNYEYTLDTGSTWSTVTAKPLVVGNVAKAIGAVGVRVKAIGGNPASTALYNTTAFTYTGSAPLAPTVPATDDELNTFNWTNTSGYTALSDYEYTLNGGSSYATVTAKPIVVGDVAKANGQVGVRVKAAGGNPASTTLYNTSPFTVSTPTDEILTMSNVLKYFDAVSSTVGITSGNVTSVSNLGTSGGASVHTTGNQTPYNATLNNFDVSDSFLATASVTPAIDSNETIVLMVDMENKQNTSSYEHYFFGTSGHGISEDGTYYREKFTSVASNITFSGGYAMPLTGKHTVIVTRAGATDNAVKVYIDGVLKGTGVTGSTGVVGWDGIWGATNSVKWFGGIRSLAYVADMADSTKVTAIHNMLVARHTS